MQVAVFNAAIDDRYGQGIIRSRIGLSAEAELFDQGTDFLGIIEQRLKQQRLACVLVERSAVPEPRTGRPAGADS